MEDNIAFLAGDVSRLFRKRLEAVTRDLCITGPQWRALARIDAAPGINQGALASYLEVEAMTVGRMVDRLEKLGLVERRADPADRRAWLLHLTDRALPALAELRQRATAFIARSTEIFADDELAAAVAVLRRMREHLLALEDEAPDDAQQEALAHG